MLNPKNLGNGKEQIEIFRNRITKKKSVQYDYRDHDGELFSCIRSTIKDCWQAKVDWIKKKEEK